MKKRSYLVGLLTMSIIAVAVSYRPAESRASRDTSPPSVIRLTPPAPVFDETKRVEELAARRKRVADTIGLKSMLVLFSAQPRVYTNDVDYHFRQENNLYYLTNLNQSRATLVLMPGNKVTPEIVFVPRRNALAETWTGHMYSPQEVAQLSGIKEIWEASEFGPFIKAVRARESYQPKPENVLMSERTAPAAGPTTSPGPGFEAIFGAVSNNEASLYLLNFPREGESREYRQEQLFAAAWKDSGFKIQNASPIFSQMRVYKSPMEIALMQHAIDITIEAHQRAQAFAGEAKWDYEVDAHVLFTFKLRNADNWGYPNIVGCGVNATTLHYQESQGRVHQGLLMLMDVGAEYKHYTADITRTFPVNGKFTKEQAEIYQIVYDAQEAAASVSKPGATLSDINRAATEVIKDGLLKLGLITDKGADWQYRMWFMHGTGHWLGMAVHDVGGGSKFAPGAIFTNEPGIYIRPDALENLAKSSGQEKYIAAIKPAFEKYKGIGVRIEDDMLITEDGVKWMTAALPRSIAEVEAFIAKARPRSSN